MDSSSKAPIQLGPIQVRFLVDAEDSGGSATVFPPYTVSPVDGIRAALGRPPQAAGDPVEIGYAPGAYASERVPVAPLESLRLPDGSGPGAQVSFLAEDGTLLSPARATHHGIEPD